jgi:hypothetical protein
MKSGIMQLAGYIALLVIMKIKYQILVGKILSEEATWET